MEKHEHVHKNLRHIFTNNFVGGIAWGLGATVGASIILTIFGLIASKINLIPVVGDFVIRVNDFVLQNSPQLLR